MSFYKFFDTRESFPVFICAAVGTATNFVVWAVLAAIYFFADRGVLALYMADATMWTAVIAIYAGTNLATLARLADAMSGEGTAGRFLRRVAHCAVGALPVGTGILLLVMLIAGVVLEAAVGGLSPYDPMLISDLYAEIFLPLIAVVYGGAFTYFFRSDRV